MARPKPVVACIFCDELPCVCNKPARTEAKPKPDKVKTEPKPKPAPAPKVEVEAPPPRPKLSVREAMKAKAAEQKITPPKPLPPIEAPPRPVQDIKPDEALLRAAIRALEPVLHPTERRRYAKIINSEPDAKERAAAWKGRRGEVGEHTATTGTVG